LPPLTALAWLVRKLHQNNGHLRKDDIVLTGSLLKPLSIDKPLLRLAMTIESLGSLSTA
jgi:2-keto-4-pentenoate hydratase